MFVIIIFAYAAAMVTCVLRAYRIGRSLGETSPSPAVIRKRTDDAWDCLPPVLAAVGVFFTDQPWILSVTGSTIASWVAAVTAKLDFVQRLLGGLIV